MHSSLLLALNGLAVLLVLAGVAWYDHTPGRMPDITPVTHTTGLVLALHPRCPCSRGTVEVLANLLPQLPPDLRVTILLTEPMEAGPDWNPGNLVDPLAGNPRILVIRDAGGRQAAALGARTSGTVLLTTPDGIRRFTGGITRERGDATIGQSALALIEAARGNTMIPTPVYGCSLVLPKKNL